MKKSITIIRQEVEEILKVHEPYYHDLPPEEKASFKVIYSCYLLLTASLSLSNAVDVAEMINKLIA